MESVIEAGIQLATVLGAGGLGAALLSYHRNRRKDSMDAYSDLVAKLEARCVTLEERCDSLDKALRREREEIARLRLDLAAEREARAGLERQLAQVGRSAAYVLKDD